MKKLILLFMVVILSVSGFYTYGFNGFGFGYSLSWGKYSVDTSLEEKHSSRMASMGTIGYEFGIKNNISMNIGLAFSRKASQNSNFDFFLSEISLPVIVKYRFLSSSTPYILGGAEIGKVISHRAENASTVYDLDDITKSIDYGLILGVGAEFKLNKNYSNNCLYIEGRYHMGLVDLDETEYVVKPRMIVFIFGYRF